MASEFFCDTCNTNCSGPESFKQHIEGQKHRRKVGLSSAQLSINIVKDRTHEAETTRNSSLHCSIGDINCSGPENYADHLECKQHNKKVSSSQACKSDETADQVLVNEDSYDFCNVCQVSISGPECYKQHIEGSKHKQKLSSTQTTLCSVDLNDIIEDGNNTDLSYVKCDLCQVTFTGTQQAYDHYKGKKHNKAERRALLLDQLKQKQGISNMEGAGEDRPPSQLSNKSSDSAQELGSSPGPNSTNNIVESNVKIDLDYDKCNLCQVTFPGVQEAVKHYEGKKHKKAMKRSIVFEELKNSNRISNINGIKKDRPLLEFSDVSCDSIQENESSLRFNASSENSIQKNDLSVEINNVSHDEMVEKKDAIKRGHPEGDEGIELLKKNRKGV